jgi:hypothetical protein
VTHQLEFAVDGVVDTAGFLTNVVGGRDGRGVLVGTEIWFWEGTGVYLKDGLGIQNVGGVEVAGERQARPKTGFGVYGRFGGL